ncbi:hypothetical protein EJB05_52688, partial [Eragrostis curvula]
MFTFQVAKALIEMFGEMIFVHGFVHGDPHPGNILVSSTRPREIFTSKSVLGTQMSGEEKRRLKEDLNSLGMDDISSFTESLPPDFLVILRTDGLLRSILGNLGVPRHVRLLTYAKCVVHGLEKQSKMESGKSTLIIIILSYSLTLCDIVSH